MPITTKTETTDRTSNIQAYLCLSNFASNPPLYPPSRSAAVHALNPFLSGAQITTCLRHVTAQPLSFSCQLLRPQPARSACVRVPHHSQQQLRNYSIRFH